MIIDHQRGKELFAQALDNGAKRISPIRCEWDLSGDCSDPRYVFYSTRPYPRRTPVLKYGVIRRTEMKELAIPKDGICFFIDLVTRCRRCPNCMRQRRNLWTARSMAEIEASPGRTWFVTLTVSPDSRFRAWNRACVRARSYGISDLEAEPVETQFRYLAKEMAPHLTKYLKRLRRSYESNRTDVLLRYLLVAEPHKDGFPHWHLLVHEWEGVILQKRFLRWGLGFVKAKLVENGSKAARYVSKYCSKAIGARVRASKFYGSPYKTPVGIANIVKRVYTSLSKKKGNGNDSTVCKGIPATEGRRLTFEETDAETTSAQSPRERQFQSPPGERQFKEFYPPGEIPF